MQAVPATSLTKLADDNLNHIPPRLKMSVTCGAFHPGTKTQPQVLTLRLIARFLSKQIIAEHGLKVLDRASGASR
jgi:hypothetical protein